MNRQQMAGFRLMQQWKCHFYCYVSILHRIAIIASDPSAEKKVTCDAYFTRHGLYLYYFPLRFTLFTFQFDFQIDFLLYFFFAIQATKERENIEDGVVEYHWNFFKIITTFSGYKMKTNAHNDATIVRFGDHVNAIQISPLGSIIFFLLKTIFFSVPLISSLILYELHSFHALLSPRK